MSGGEWNTSRERKQLAADARELEREQIRLAKRMLRDLRWSAERSTLRESDWADLLKLHHDYGKEGPMQLFQELVPYWSQSQIMNGGTPCPRHHSPDWLAEINCKKSAQIRWFDRRPQPVRLQAHPASPAPIKAPKAEPTPHANPRLKPLAPVSPGWGLILTFLHFQKHLKYYP
jgi:hypothetical protein